MPLRLREIEISNFKSFKQQKVTLSDFNVIVGRNASGKTNLIEFFKFVKKVLLEEYRPFMPFIEWWSFQNIVWEGNDTLPIKAELKFDIDGLCVEYSLAFSGVGGAFRLLNEKLNIIGNLSLEREGQILRIRHDREFLKKNAKKIRRVLPELDSFLSAYIPRREKSRITFESLEEQEVNFPSEAMSLTALTRFGILYRFMSTEDLAASIIRPDLLRPDFGSENVGVIVSEAWKPRHLPVVNYVIDELRKAIQNIIILRHPNMDEAKKPSIPKKENSLLEDASNLHNVLYNWFLEKGKIPDKIEAAISRLFPDTQIRLTLTPEGKVYMQIREGNMQLSPPCISDGFYKILAILVALESKPSVLAIDEVENSLFAEALQYVIDELRTSRTTIIATTHSPMTVDLVRLEDLLIAEKTLEGTTLGRIDNAKQLRQKLAELKLTQSESWLSGAFNT